MTAAAIDPNDHRHGWVTMIARPNVLRTIGVFLAIVWALCVNMRINTSENWLLVVGYGYAQLTTTATWLPSFNVFGQIYYLFTGGVSAPMMGAMFYGWLDEAISITVSLGLPYALHLVQRKMVPLGMTNQVSKNAMNRDKLFTAGIIATFVWDAYTDLNYGPGNMVAHIGVALPINLVSFFFLPLCIICFQAASSI